MPAPLSKHVPERDPVFLDQDLEAFKGSIVGVKEELGKGAELGRSVPAVRAVDQYIVLELIDRLQNVIDASQNPSQYSPIARAVEKLVPGLGGRLL